MYRCDGADHDASSGHVCHTSAWTRTRTTNALPVSRSGHLILPAPTREFANDFAFRVTGRTPEHPFLWRRWWGDLDWVHRVGMDFTGHRGRMFPGWSLEREAVILSQPSVQRAMREIAAVAPTSQITSAATVTPASSEQGRGGRMSSGSSSADMADSCISGMQDRARKILRQIGDTQSYAQCRLLGIIVRQFFFRMFDRIEFSNSDFYERVNRYYHIPRVTLVIVPLHRSYLDFMILAYCLIVMGFPPPHIAAGEDFLHMGKIAQLMRATGAFFIRRSFRDDVLYGALIKEYVRQLILHRQSVEFFIEGTRSRTAKTMTPKLGMLKFVVDAFCSLQDDIDDVLFLPVGITYDELPETHIYANELLGIPKPRETMRNLFKARTRLVHNHGCIHLHLGEVISLRAWRSRVSPTCASPAHGLLSLSFRITDELQRSIVVTATTLVAATIVALTRRDDAQPTPAVEVMGWHELCDGVCWLAAGVRQRGGLLAREVRQLTAAQTVRAGLRHLEQLVRLEGAPPAYVVDARGSSPTSPQRRQDARTPQAEPRLVYSESPPSLPTRVALLTYTNQLIHIFVDEAVLWAAMRGTAAAARETDATRNTPVGGCGAPDGSSAPETMTHTSSSSSPHLVARRAEVVRAVQLLHLLLSNEFPRYAESRGHTTETAMIHWVDEIVARVKCASSLHDGAAAPPQANAPDSLTWLALPHDKRSSGFLLQLILPHVEAAYYAAVSVYVVSAQLGESAVQQKDVVAALHAVAMQYSAENSSSSSSAMASSTPSSTPLPQPTPQKNQQSYCFFCYGDTVVCCKEVLARYVHTVMQVCASSDVAKMQSLVPSADRPTREGDGEHAGRRRMSFLYGVIQHVNALRCRPATDVDAEVGRLSKCLLALYAKISSRHKL